MTRVTERSRLTERSRAGLAALVAIVGLAGCARVVDGQGTPATGGRGAPSFPSQSAAPTPSPTAATTTAADGSPAACPTITDPTTRLRFGCLTTAMVNQAASGYNINIVKQTQANPNWYLSQSTLVIDALTAAQLATGIDKALSDFIDQGFPAGSKGTETGSKPITISAHPALLVTGSIAIDKSSPGDVGLKASADRIVALGVLRGDGTAAVLILDVPDTLPNLYPAMTTVATSARLI